MKTTFEYCGLDKENNFLQAPICPCGCGEYANIILKSDEDVFGFMYTMLEENECDHCAIFALKDNNHILLGMKIDGEIVCYTAKNNSFEHGYEDIFTGLQDKFEFHCYGLLEQVDEESYRIIME